MDFKARAYSPTLGRFISADTIVPGAGNPQAFNRYSYSLSNPLKYTDPTGHCPADDPEDCTYEDDLQNYLLDLLEQRNADEFDEFDDLMLMDLFLQRAFRLYRDPLDALCAATRVVRGYVPNSFMGHDFGFGYDAKSNRYFYERATTKFRLGDTGFGGFTDWDDHNQISHFIGEAYISLYQLRKSGGKDDATWLVIGNEAKGVWDDDAGEFLRGTYGEHASVDIQLGYVAINFARDIYANSNPSSALTTAISTIQTSPYRPPVSPAPGPPMSIPR
jgi:hypothetical protein